MKAFYDDNMKRRKPEPEDRTRDALLMGDYWVLRREYTGVTQYRFCHRGQRFGTGAAHIMPGFPTVLHCGGLVLNSKFDPGRTVVPGVSREIVDADNATAVAARLTWLGDSRYELVMNWDMGTVVLEIRSAGDMHEFYRDGKRIATVCELPDPRHLPDWEVNFCMRTWEALSNETAMLLMSFPLLRFTL